MNINRHLAYYYFEQIKLGFFYSPNGNIAGKTGMGTYVYSPSQPNALESLTGSTEVTVHLTTS